MARRSRLGPYRLVERLAVGGLGEVHRAVRVTDGLEVALKLLLPTLAEEQEVTNALVEEAALVSQLSHPNIARVVDYGQIENEHYIAYEFVFGRDVRRVLERARRKGGLDPRFAFRVAIEMAGALHYAHERADAQGRLLGIVHRDVAPANILVSFQGEVKLADFGIARARGRVTRTGQGVLKGTARYMSPEQVTSGPLDGRCDIFSLGVVLWEMLTGTAMRHGRTMEVVAQIASGVIPDARERNPDITEEASAILRKMLAREPDHRYATAAELQAALLACVHGTGADRVFESDEAAVYLLELFPEHAAERAAREESLSMGDDKGGSDLDVFEGLAKKSQRPSALTPPPPSGRKGTLIGTGAPAGSTPPPLPPPSRRPPGAGGTMPGVGQLPPPSGAPPKSLPTPLPPPSKRPPSKPPSRPAPPKPPSKAPSSLPVPTPPPKPQSTQGSGALPPPTPPPKAPSMSGATVEMDWDDDEESTHVYDKIKHGEAPDPENDPRPAAGAPASKVGAAAALLASSGGAAPPVSSRPAARPASVPPPAIAKESSVPPPPQIPMRPRNQSHEATSIRPRIEPQSSGGSKAGLWLGLVALLLVVGMGVYLFLPKTGDLKIDVQAKSGGVEKAEIYVDGQKYCDVSPCLVRDLESGSRTIIVQVPGMPRKVQTETVESGKERFVLIEVDGEAAADEGTGVKLATKQPGLKVFVDGKDRGPLPTTLDDLEPGEHKLKIEGGERFEPLEKTITVSAGKVEDLGDIQLKVLKGDLVLDLETEGAEVTLIGEGDDDKKVEKRLPESLWKSPPVKLEALDAEKEWTIVATKKGFKDFERTIAFDDGEVEKTLTIKLRKEGEEDEPEPPPPPTSAGPGPGPVSTGTPPPPPPAGGNGTLNINSIPVSKVLLDGKPLGSTPKVGISVSAGSHTVTFIHPEKGKKSVTVTVGAGETKTAAVKF